MLLKSHCPLIYKFLLILGSLYFGAALVHGQALHDTRRWLGAGQVYGDYGQEDLDTTVDLKGLTYELMESHEIFKNSTTWGKAFLDTRFSKSFEDFQGNYHAFEMRAFHRYYSFGLGKTIEVNHRFLYGGAVDLLAGVGMGIFNKKYITASGTTITFEDTYSLDLLTGYQVSIFVDFNNKWTLGYKSSVFRNRFYIEFGGIEADVNHYHSHMIFIGTKAGPVSCVPTLYVPCD